MDAKPSDTTDEKHPEETEVLLEILALGMEQIREGKVLRSEDALRRLKQRGEA